MPPQFLEATMTTTTTITITTTSATTPTITTLPITTSQIISPSTTTSEIISPVKTTSRRTTSRIVSPTTDSQIIVPRIIEGKIVKTLLNITQQINFFSWIKTAHKLKIAEKQLFSESEGLEYYKTYSDLFEKTFGGPVTILCNIFGSRLLKCGKNSVYDTLTFPEDMILRAKAYAAVYIADNSIADDNKRELSNFDKILDIIIARFEAAKTSSTRKTEDSDEKTETKNNGEIKNENECKSVSINEKDDENKKMDGDIEGNGSGLNMPANKTNIFVSEQKMSNEEKVITEETRNSDEKKRTVYEEKKNDSKEKKTVEKTETITEEKKIYIEKKTISAERKKYPGARTIIIEAYYDGTLVLDEDDNHIQQCCGCRACIDYRNDISYAEYKKRKLEGQNDKIQIKK